MGKQDRTSAYLYVVPTQIAAGSLPTASQCQSESSIGRASRVWLGEGGSGSARSQGPGNWIFGDVNCWDAVPLDVRVRRG